MNYDEDYWFEKLQQEIEKSDVGAWEFLAQKGVPAGLSYETVFNLYLRLVRWDGSECEVYLPEDFIQEVKDRDPEDIKEVNGTYYISKRRRKTGTPFTAVVLPFAMDAYKRGIHFISNQKYNLYLKVIQQSVLPNKRLHSHLFRHTYCTFLLNEGVRMDVVSKAAGHSSITMTETFYAELTKDTIISEITHSLNI